VVREPIQYAEDAEIIHSIFKKEYVLLVDLGKQKKLDIITGLKIEFREIGFLIFLIR
jgi:hypothetical protein